MIEAVPGTRFLVAGSGTHEEELKKQAEGARADGARHLPRLDRRRRAAQPLRRSPTSPWCPRSTSPSAWSRWRRWPPAARASSPTPAACARSSPTRTPASASAARDPAALAEVAIRVLSDPDLEARLIAEAHEHVRRFDWTDIAAQTAEVYADLVGAKLGRPRRGSAVRRRALPKLKAPPSRRRASSRCPSKQLGGGIDIAPASWIRVSTRATRWPCSSRPISVRWRRRAVASSLLREAGAPTRSRRRFSPKRCGHARSNALCGRLRGIGRKMLAVLRQMSDRQSVCICGSFACRTRPDRMEFRRCGKIPPWP